LWHNISLLQIDLYLQLLLRNCPKAPDFDIFALYACNLATCLEHARLQQVSTTVDDQYIKLTTSAFAKSIITIR